MKVNELPPLLKLQRTLPVLIWYGMLQQVQTQQMTGEILDQIKTLDLQEGGVLEQNNLMLCFEDKVKDNTKAMKNIKKHLEPIGTCVISVGVIFYIFTLLDYIVPLSFMRPPNISAWIVITLSVAMFLLLTSTLYFALALHFCNLNIILDGWIQRESEFSWVLFGIPITKIS